MTTTNKPYFASLNQNETELLKTASEVAVWFAVKSYAGNGICFASIRQLAQRAHASKETIAQSVKRFIELGLVQDLGMKKSAYGHWPTHHLKVSAYRTDVPGPTSSNPIEVSGGKTEVSGTAANVSDSTDTKYKGNINEIKNNNGTVGVEDNATSSRKSSFGKTLSEEEPLIAEDTVTSSLSTEPIASGDRTPEDLEEDKEADKIIQLYKAFYRHTLGHPHPELSPEQLTAVRYGLLMNSADLMLSTDDWVRIIRHWFVCRPVKKTDYNLNHFVTGLIISTRYEEVVRDDKCPKCSEIPLEQEVKHEFNAERQTYVETPVCPVCGGTSYWKRSDGVELCGTCHPKT